MLENILQQDPKYGVARQTLANFLQENNCHDAAISRLKEGLALDPTHSDMAMNLARLQVARSDVTLALATF
ncbi:MAG: tetratricopeptide repeat protein [Glaciimonas sp.]|nr:tetratricopeptide repeat protein [Glaciimonas sp.]